MIYKILSTRERNIMSNAEENFNMGEVIADLLLPTGRSHIDSLFAILDMAHTIEPTVFDAFNNGGTFGDIMNIMLPMYNGEGLYDEYMYDEYNRIDPIDLVMEESLNSYKNTERKPITLDVEIIPYHTTDKTVLACSICQDDFGESDNVISLSCDHVFHEKCISEWGRYKPECPNCKKNIKISGDDEGDEGDDELFDSPV